MWQQNLFSNLLVVVVLTILGLMVYCKVTNKTLMDIIRGIKEATTEIE